MCLFLGVPNPLLLAYFGIAIIDGSPFADKIWTKALVEFAATVELLSFQTASVGVTWPTLSNDPTVPAHGLYPVDPIFRISKHLVEIVCENLGVEKIVRETPYLVEELTVMLGATENHSSRVGQAWVVWKHTEPSVDTTEEQSVPGHPDSQNYEQDKDVGMPQSLMEPPRGTSERTCSCYSPYQGSASSPSENTSIPVGQVVASPFRSISTVGSLVPHDGEDIECIESALHWLHRGISEVIEPTGSSEFNRGHRHIHQVPTGLSSAKGPK